MAITAITASCVVLLIPLLVQMMAPNNTQEEVNKITNYFNENFYIIQWGRIFILIAITVIVTTIIFDLTAEVDPRAWTYKTSTSTHCLAKNSLTVDSLAPEHNNEKLFIIDSLDRKESKVTFEAKKADTAA